MILYHPSQSEQVADLEDLLNKTIDVPADQVLIEGMVIELTEDQLKELGVEWQTFGKDWQLSFLSDGRTPPSSSPTTPPTACRPAWPTRSSRPSGPSSTRARRRCSPAPPSWCWTTGTPRSRSRRTCRSSTPILTYNTTSFNVKFETAGITLNIRPRISQDGESVSLQILAEVSEAPKADYITINGSDVAPVINRRIVETVARVNDNTPFIIGGLIRNEKDQTRQPRPHPLRHPHPGPALPAEVGHGRPPRGHHRADPARHQDRRLQPPRAAQGQREVRLPPQSALPQLVSAEGGGHLRRRLPGEQPDRAADHGPGACLRAQAPGVRRPLALQGPDQGHHPGRGRRGDPHDLRDMPQPAAALSQDTRTTTSSCSSRTRPARRASR